MGISDALQAGTVQVRSLVVKSLSSNMISKEPE
jgi:hypothetical protein